MVPRIHHLRSTRAHDCFRRRLFRWRWWLRNCDRCGNNFKEPSLSLQIAVGLFLESEVDTIAALAWIGLFYFSPRFKTPIDSIAVLPFSNATGDANVEYLSDGITEGVINSLSQLPQLRVMARSTVFHYKGRDIDPQKIGRDLNVRAVLTGTLVQHGDDVRVQAELVDVGNGSELWGEQYHEKLSDALALQEDRKSTRLNSSHTVISYAV